MVLNTKISPLSKIKRTEAYTFLFFEERVTMANVNLNVNALAEQAPAMASPTRTDDQILPRSRWVPVGKRNCYLVVEKSQSNPDTIRYNRDTARYICQLDEQWFDLTKDTLRDALQITPVNNNNPFSSPPIPDALINFVNNLGNPKVVKTLSAVEYTEKVAKHQRYLAGEKGSDPDSPAPKPTKATKKSKPSAPKVAPVTKPAAAKAAKAFESTLSQQPKPKPAPAKTQEKKRKLVTEPRFDDEEADMKRAVEEILKSVHDAHRGPLPPVAIDLLTLQTPKKVSPTEQYIFQRRTPAPTEASGYAESPSIYTELGLTGSDTESDEEVPPFVKVGAQDEGQAGPNPGVQTKGQAGSNPGNDAEPQPQSSPVVHAEPNLEHMDLEGTDVSTQQNPEQIDEGFTATAYPNVQENLKLTVDEHVFLEEPASFTGTLSSLQHLAEDFSSGDRFFNDKPSEAENEKTTAETKAESMVSVTIQQDTSTIPPMTTPIMANLIQDNKHLVERLDSHGSCLYTLENLDIPQQVSKAVDKIVTDAVDWAIQALEKSINRDHSDELLTNLAEARRKKKKRHDSPKTPPGSPPHQPPPPPLPVGPSGTSRSLGAFRSSQLPLPPPPSSTSQSDQSKSTIAPSSSKTDASAEYTAWTTTNTRLRPSVSSIPEDLHMDDDTAPDEQVHSSDDEDIGNAHISNLNLQQDWWKPLEEDKPATPEPAWSIPSSDLLVLMNNWASTLASTYTPPLENSLLAQTGDMIIFMDWFCKKQGITELKPRDLEGPAFELVKVFHPNVIHLQYQMEECHKLLIDSVDESIIRYNVSKPLPLGGPPGQMKAAYYLDVGLKQMVPDQMWIEEECKYDIAAMYGISYWWFQRQ
nr:hypothetical protein [Tanacetum cinerariifolium]